MSRIETAWVGQKEQQELGVFRKTEIKQLIK